jgi:hypothetical protein
MEADFCVEALEDALARHGKPEIFNTDQVSQFTSHAFSSVLREAGIAISMDGKGAWRDNVFVERLWRSVKYEAIDLRAYDTVSTARASIGRYLAFYNEPRPHSSLDRRTPDQASFDRLPHPAAASTRQDIHLSKPRSLFRHTETPLYVAFQESARVTAQTSYHRLNFCSPFHVSFLKSRRRRRC